MKVIDNAHTNRVRTIAITPDEKLLITGDDDKIVNI